MYALHKAIIGRANVLFGRRCIYSKDFEGLSDAHVTGRHVAPTILFLLSPPTLSLSGFPLAFLLFLLPSLALSLSRFPLPYLLFLLSPPTLSLSGFPLAFLLLLPLLLAVSRIGPTPKQAREYPAASRESRLRLRVSLIGGEFVKPRRFALVPREPAMTYSV